MRKARGSLGEAITAAVPAAILSGLPSTIYAFVRRDDPLEATEAAGSMLLPEEHRRGLLIAAALPVHIGLSIGWTWLMGAALPRRRPIIEGTLAGLAIAAIDLGVVGRRFPRIRDLDPIPQIADHLAFGIVAMTALRGKEKSALE